MGIPGPVPLDQKYLLIAFSKMSEAERSLFRHLAVRAKKNDFTSFEAFDFTRLVGKYIELECGPFEEDEHFVVKAKDINAPFTISSYINAYQSNLIPSKQDKAFLAQLDDLTARAGVNHISCKEPD